MAARVATRRLFFALWPEETEKEQMTAAVRHAVIRCGGRPVPPSCYHVTLAFLGSVPEDKVAILERLAGQIALMAHGAPIQLTFDRIEYWRRAALICATGEPSPDAERLAGVFKSKLVEAGFTPDLKPFRPHVTVARKVPPGNHEEILERVRWKVTSSALVDSRATPGGSSYSILHSWPLCEEGAENLQNTGK